MMTGYFPEPSPRQIDVGSQLDLVTHGDHLGFGVRRRLLAHTHTSQGDQEKDHPARLPDSDSHAGNLNIFRYVAHLTFAPVFPR